MLVVDTYAPAEFEPMCPYCHDPVVMEDKRCRKCGKSRYSQFVEALRQLARCSKQLHEATFREDMGR